jgi:hypothetical protein
MRRRAKPKEIAKMLSIANENMKALRVRVTLRVRLATSSDGNK